jgi:hypothetical protein
MVSQARANIRKPPAITIQAFVVSMKSWRTRPGCWTTTPAILSLFTSARQRSLCSSMKLIEPHRLCAKPEREGFALGRAIPLYMSGWVGDQPVRFVHDIGNSPPASVDSQDCAGLNFLADNVQVGADHRHSDDLPFRVLDRGGHHDRWLAAVAPCDCLKRNGCSIPGILEPGPFPVVGFSPSIAAGDVSPLQIDCADQVYPDKMQPASSDWFLTSSIHTDNIGIGCHLLQRREY